MNQMNLMHTLAEIIVVNGGKRPSNEMLAEYAETVFRETPVGELKRLVTARDAARTAVVTWMNDEGAAMRIRSNSDAPGWAAYELAENELEHFVATFGADVG